MPKTRMIEIDWETIGGEGPDSGDVADIVIDHNFLDVAYGFHLYAMQTIPDAVTAPLDNYDITIEDKYGYDLLGGAGADRSDSDVEFAAPLISTSIWQPPINGPLTIKIANVTDGEGTTEAKGKIVLFFTA